MARTSFTRGIPGPQWLTMFARCWERRLSARSGPSPTTATPATSVRRRHFCHLRQGTSRLRLQPVQRAQRTLTSPSRRRAPLPDFPGIGRNTFRGPRYQDIDLTIAKEFGLPSMKFLGEGAKIQLRMTAYNVFNKLNLAPFTFGSASTVVSYFNNGTVPVANPLFGTAINGLAGRVLELQGRVSF